MGSRTKEADLVALKHQVALYLKSDSFAAAEELLANAIKTYGKSATLHNLVGLVYHRQNRFDEALNAFKEALEGDPEDLEGYLNTAATLADLSCYDQAKDMFAAGMQRKFRTLNGAVKQLVSKHLETAILYDRAGKGREAEDEFRKAERLSTEPEQLLWLAQILIEQESFARAEDVLERLRALDPNSFDAHLWLGVLAFKLGEKAKAHDFWSKALVLEPDSSLARTYLAVSSQWTIPHHTF